MVTASLVWFFTNSSASKGYDSSTDSSAVEVALIWLLVLLNAISLHRGLIATLILFILVGITFLIIYSNTIQLQFK